MSKSFSPILKPYELLELSKNNDIVLVDASNGAGAFQNYKLQHLKGALYVDLNTELANIKDDLAMGGRHPLPTEQQFSDTLTDLGIAPSTHVVVYDDKNGANAAARFWWMLKAAGHAKVQVLDGGFQAAVTAGFPVSSQKENPLEKKPYKFERWLLPKVDMEEVDKLRNNKEFVIVDVRDYERYLGEKEPIDLVAGHIPGAINIPFSSNLDAKGFFLSPEELRLKYGKELGNRDAEHVIVHCGSGVTACHTLLAIAQAGLEIPKLYVGSWSEWSRNDKPIAKGIEGN